jgi:dTDP-4-dehydrorhamnose 3,5-epimerase-like enzyme
MNQNNIKIIHFPTFGSSEIGFLSFIEDGKGLPFQVKRVYWVSKTPIEVARGHHAHKALHQIIIAANGRLKIKLESISGEKKEFELSESTYGLYVPPGWWREIEFSENAVLLCLVDAEYDEADYIRDYEEFKRLK